MSSDQIQPERKWHDEDRPRTTQLVGRAWVKRDFEFWRRCTIERYTSTGVTVAMDDMEELTVGFDDVAQFNVAPGELVYWQPSWQQSLGSYPAFIVSVQNEAVELELFGGRNRRDALLRDLWVYDDLVPPEWPDGVRVFAYKWEDFSPPLFLYFPGRVVGTFDDHCVEVEFLSLGNAMVPATLIERLDVNVGDTVYTCTSMRGHGIGAREAWAPCRVLRRDGDSMLLQDDAGEPFEAKMEMIAILPKGYQMFDGKFEKIPQSAPQQAGEKPPELRGFGEVHIVRTDRWEDAADDPITRDDVAALVINDPELNWSPEPWEAMTKDRVAMRKISILWRGEPCFSWHGNEIRCKAPNEAELAKMIEMAIELDANVIGHDGEQLH